MVKEIDWIVVPGSPGMSSKYLKVALSKPFNQCKLHYYSIHGAPESIEKKPDIETINSLLVIKK